MPPRSKKSVVEDTAERVPIPQAPKKSFEDEGFIADLLQRYPHDVCSVMDLIAQTPEVDVADYHISLTSSLLVDFWFQNLTFAHSRCWTAAQTKPFLYIVEGIRKLLLSTKDVKAAKARFKELMLEQYATTKEVVDKLTKEAARKASEAQQESAKPPPPEPSAKDKAGKGKQPPPEPVPQQPAEPPKPAPYFTVDDIAAITQHVTTGLLQHHRLYIYAFSEPRLPTERTSTEVVYETAAVPVALRKAMTQEEYESWAAKRKEAEEAEEEALRAAEEKARQEEAAREQALRDREEEQRRAAEEEEANRLLVDDTEVRKVLEAVESDIKSQLRDRQEALVARIAALEAEMSEAK